MIEQLNHLTSVWWNWMWPMFWQVGALIAVIGAVDLLFRKVLWPQIRYALWLLVIVKLILPPSLGLPTGIAWQIQPMMESAWRDSTGVGEISVLVSEEPLVADGFSGNADEQVIASTEPVVRQSFPAREAVGVAPAAATVTPVARLSWKAALMAVWLCGALAMGLWSGGRFHHLLRVTRREVGRRALPDPLSLALARAAQRLHLRRLPRIVVSDTVGSPGVIGPFRSTLFVPARGVEKLSACAAEHVFLHELAHIKRGDLKVQAGCLLVQICYWFNPFLWFVQRRLQHLREMCCDATVARILKDDVEQYRQTIVATARWLLTQTRDHAIGLLGLVEDRSRLLARMDCLRQAPRRYHRVRLVATAALMVLLGVCLLPMAGARQADGASISADGDVFAFDDFDRGVALDWDIINADPSHYSVTKKPGTLTITTQTGHFKEAHNDYRNLFLIDTPAADQDFQITTCLSGFQPREAYNQAGLICWDDEDHYLEWIFQKMKVRGFVFAAGVEAGGPTRYDYIPTAGPCEKLWLRVTKRGDSYEGASSTDGRSFTVHTVQQWGDGSPLRVGLFALSGSLTEPLEVDASFEFFEVASVPEQQPPAQITGYAVPQASLDIPSAWQPCAERLAVIRGALNQYETDTGSLPDWLSDLVPDYLRADDLIWPADGPEKAYRTPDPKMPCSFGYQYPASLLGPGGKTFRQWKDQQRAICGDVVPLVRYYGANRRCLNLSFDGRIYVSDLVWERDLDPQKGRLYESALARPVVPSATGESLLPRWKEAAGKDLVQAFRGQYLHRSRGHDYLRAVVETYLARDGATYYLSRMADMEGMLVVDGNGRPKEYVYRHESRGAFGRYTFAPNQLVWERKLPQHEDAETFTWGVSEGALPDFNSRPDPYLIQHVLLRFYDPAIAGKQTFTVYDIDQRGTGINEYEIVVELVDEDGVTLPNGRFPAQHFVQVQRTVSNTWYKKRPGSTTDYWVDDDFNILRIYRHREPYEIILENHEGIPLPQPASVTGPAATFGIPDANLHISEALASCAEHLRIIYAGLRRYEEDHGHLPDWLSQLVPRYLEAETLFCPRDAGHTTPYWPDPNLPCSYCYELNPRHLNGRPPLDKTMRHYKNAQRKLFGDVVPIVRCFHHDAVLNLAWDGTVYTSGTWFERLFIPDYHHGMALPGRDVRKP